MTTAADISPEAVERMAQFLPIAHMQEELDKAAAMLRALRSALTASEKDAARYRWLRDKADPADCDIYLASDSAFVSFRAAAVDASIDAAMEKANG